VSGNGRKRSALLINNKRIGVVPITHLSDEDSFVTEISYGNTKFYGVSSYFNIIEDIKIYRVSQEECSKLRESVPYVKVYRYNPKYLCPKLNGYGDNGQRILKL